MSDAEKTVENLTAKVANINATLSDADLYAKEPERAQSLQKERGAVAKDLERAEADWLSAMERYEQATSEPQG